jgi:hypothetical protein
MGIAPLAVHSQHTNLSLNEDYYGLVNRFHILQNGLSTDLHPAFRPYSQQFLRMKLDSLMTRVSKKDIFNAQFLKNDNGAVFGVESSRRPFLRHFYKTKADLLGVKSDDLDLHANPVLYLSSGYASNTSTPFINTRGFEIRALIDNKVGFYTFLTENQARFPEYTRNWISEINVVPHEAFWKDFKTSGVDFFTARGYISFNATKNINVQFGQDRFFIGNGMRSMILSDFTAPYPFLKVNTRVWKFQYTNLFAQMKADAFGTLSGSAGTRRYPNKYFAFHHLSFNVKKNFNIGIFESIMFGREDSLGNNGFEISYLNPVIFYRAAEQYNGSEDNVILGLDANYIFRNRFEVYGQFLFDEFLLDEITAGDGWWGNKFAFQVGGKYLNVLGVDNLDLQVEYNQARPYTYSHRGIFTNYAHYMQPVAHPLGSNFREILANVRFQLLPELTANARFIYYMKGVDPAGQNFGGNIIEPYNSRVSNYGNETGQGIRNTVAYSALNLSFMLKHNLFLDGDFVYRTLDSDAPVQNSDDLILTLSMRLNIARRIHEF